MDNNLDMKCELIMLKFIHGLWLNEKQYIQMLIHQLEINKFIWKSRKKEYI